MSRDVAFFAENPNEFDSLSAEQQEFVLTGGTIDDPIPGVTDGAPGVTAVQTTTETTESAKEETVIEGKSGKHTIPYSVLEETRAEAAQLRQQVADLKSQMDAALAKAVDQDKGTGTTEAQQAVIAEYQGLFPEVAEDLKPHIQQMIDLAVKGALDKVEQKVKPIEETIVANTQADADAQILKAIPDIVDLMKDPAWVQWVNDNPFVLDQRTRHPLNVNEVLDKGSPAQVIEVFTQYKSTITPPNQTATDRKTQLQEKAKEIIQGVKPRAPTTFSDLPGAGINAEHDESERYANMSDAELERAMLSMTPLQREALLSRI